MSWTYLNEEAKISSIKLMVISSQTILPCLFFEILLVIQNMAIKEVLNSTGSYLPLKKSCKKPQKGRIKFNVMEEQCKFYQGCVKGWISLPFVDLNVCFIV